MSEVHSTKYNGYLKLLRIGLESRLIWFVRNLHHIDPLCTFIRRSTLYIITGIVSYFNIAAESQMKHITTNKNRNGKIKSIVDRE